MFAAVVLALFAFSISRIEIQCSIIRLESPVAEAKDLMELTKNLTLLKKTANIAIQSKSSPFSQGGNKNVNTLIEKTKPHVHLDRRDISTAPLLNEENRFLTSSRRDRRAKDDVGNRKPKFFGPLGFLTAFGPANLATAASANANAFAKLFNAAVPVPIATPSYFTGFYEPQHYLPFSYPVLYPVPRPANVYQNFVSGIPVTPSSLLQQNSNITTEKSPQKNDTNPGTNDETNKRLADEKAQKDRDGAASRADVDDDDDEEAELRQDKRKRTTTTAKPMVVKTTTVAPKVTAPKVTEPKVTEPTPSPTNATGSYLPFYGYYGGSPQDLGHVIFTTEDPQLRYLKDYTADAFSVPFERPAAFSPYQNVDSYQSSFGNSYSPGGPFNEFLNNIESDRYVYDSENRRNSNGFRPILK